MYEIPVPDSAMRFNPHRDYDMLKSIIFHWSVRRDSKLIMGNRKIDEAHKDGENFGFERGIATALACVGDDLRRQMYDKWDTIPSCSEHDVLRLMKQWIVSYQHLVNGDMREDMTPEEARGEKRRRTEEWLSGAAESFTAYALHENFEQAELDRHRDAVLKKEEPATEDDKEWISEMLNAQQSQIQALQDLIS